MGDRLMIILMQKKMWIWKPYNKTNPPCCLRWRGRENCDCSTPTTKVAVWLGPNSGRQWLVLQNWFTIFFWVTRCEFWAVTKFEQPSFVLCNLFPVGLPSLFDYFCNYHDGRGLGKNWCLFDNLGDRKRITSIYRRDGGYAFCFKSQTKEDLRGGYLADLPGWGVLDFFFGGCYLNKGGGLFKGTQGAVFRSNTPPFTTNPLPCFSSGQGQRWRLASYKGRRGVGAGLLF